MQLFTSHIRRNKQKLVSGSESDPNRSFKVIYLPGGPMSPRSPLGPMVPLQCVQRQKKGIWSRGTPEVNIRSQNSGSGMGGIPGPLAPRIRILWSVMLSLGGGHMGIPLPSAVCIPSSVMLSLGRGHMGRPLRVLGDLSDDSSDSEPWNSFELEIV